MSTSPKLIPPALFGESDRSTGGANDCAGAGRIDRRRSSSSMSPKSAESTGDALGTAAGVLDELGGDS